MGRKQLEYALYKGGQLVAIGTIREIAKDRGVLPETIRFYQSGVYQRRAKKGADNRLQLIKLDE